MVLKYKFERGHTAWYVEINNRSTLIHGMEIPLPIYSFFFYLFIFGSVGSSLLHAGFSLQWLLLLRSKGSRCMGFGSCGSRALEHRLSSCGAQV